MLAAMDLPVELDSDDVEAYLSARDIAAAAGAPGIMEYWKSTPYLLSFMEQYRLADRVRSSVVNEPSGEVAELVRSGAGLQLPRQFTAHRLEVNGGNGRMRAVLGDLRESGLQGLLLVTAFAGRTRTRSGFCASAGCDQTAGVLLVDDGAQGDLCVGELRRGTPLHTGSGEGGAVRTPRSGCHSYRLCLVLIFGSHGSAGRGRRSVPASARGHSPAA